MSEYSMNSSLLSVILTYHNEGDLLLRAIESINQQTYQGELEILVVDDASTIRPPRPVMSRFDVRFLRSDVNLRPAAARNLGIKESKGEFVCFLDADDIYTPTRIERQVSFLADHPDAQAVGGTSIIHRDGRIWEQIPELVRINYPECINRTCVLPESIRISVVNSYLYHTGATTFRREALEAVGGFDTRCLWGEEWDIFVRIAQIGRIGFIPEPAQRYLCRSSGSITTTHSPEKYEAGAEMFRRWRNSVRGLPSHRRRSIKAKEKQWRLFASQFYLEKRRKPRKALSLSISSLLCGISFWGIRSTVRNMLWLVRSF